MFEGIKNWILNNQRISFVIGLALFGALALFLATGPFDVGVSQFFAFECSTNNDQCDTICASGSGTCVAISPDTGDDGNCDCGDGDQPTQCVPVTPTSWRGGANACKPEASGIETPPPPENWLPHVTLQNRGGLPGLATSAPYGSEDGYTCFGFEVPDGNPWAAIDALTGGVVPATKGTHTLTGQFFNNCPWEVEMTGGAAGSPTAESDYIFKTDGTIDEPIVGLDELITRGTTQLIPSCWNYTHLPGAGPQAGCTGTYSITFDMGSFNAGRAEVSLGWKHHDQVGTAPGNTTVQDGYTIVANTGRDCSKAPGEFCAGEGAGGSGTTGISGPGPGGAFNCGTGDGSVGCWCGEWGDAIWAQRHAAAGHQCSPGYVLTAEYKAFLAENVPSFNLGDGAPDGTSDGDILNWSNGKVQAFINIMEDNFSGGNQGCNPRASGVDYAGIQEVYFAIGAGGIGLSGNGSSAVAFLCKNDVGIDPAVLTATCESGPSIRLTWNIPLGSVANGLIKRIDGGEGQFISGGIGRLTTNYTDSDVEAGHTYQYVHKAHASVASDPVDVIIEDDGTCRVLGAEPTTHLVCQDNACVSTEGVGTDQCATDADCAAGTTHLACQNNACVSVQGVGADECSTDSDCAPITTGPVCGDGTCSGGETCTICADDCGTCGSSCGDGVCGSSESCSSCANDCGSCSATCGDDVCGSGETPFNCADDCGSPGATCGDGICDNSESCSSCANDCGTCGQIGGQIGPAGQTPTGPAAATFLAFMLASVTALLYISYTHTSLFRRREVQKVTDDGEGMDFRA